MARLKLDLHVEAAEIYGFLGPAGAGSRSMLKLSRGGSGYVDAIALGVHRA